MTVINPIVASPMLSIAANRYNTLFVNRGSAGANMTTDALSLAVTKNQVYRVEENGLAISPSALYAIDLEDRAAHPERVQVPPYLEVIAQWDKTPHESGLGNNILGDNGILTIPSEILTVPCVEATTEALAYYGAILIQKGDVVRFPDEEYPIFRMTVGPHYVDAFLMTEQGGGFYLEFHHDKAHVHMPLQGGGCYILARWNVKRTKLHITGFKIPDGHAVYTKKGAIHCDAALTGDLLVGYDQAVDCSTVLLRTPNKKKTKIEFYAPSSRCIKVWPVCGGTMPRRQRL